MTQEVRARATDWDRPPDVAEGRAGRGGRAAGGRRCAGAGRGRGSTWVDRVLAKNLSVPWGIAFLPGGDALVGERDSGNVHVVRRGGGRRQVGDLSVFSQKSSFGESGLLGIALHPGFATNRWVYAYLSTRSDNRVVRMRLRGRPAGQAAPRARRHPDERAPQRRRPRVRARRAALRVDWRRRGLVERAETGGRWAARCCV